MKLGRVIVVTGLPGAGKSTLAQSLGGRYQMPVLAKDFIKEPLLDVLGATDAEGSRRLSDASFAVLFRLAAEGMRAGHGFILEGNFRPGEHEEPLRHALASASVAQVLCRVPEAERRARLAARENDSVRHAGHRFGERASAAESSAAEFGAAEFGAAEFGAAESSAAGTAAAGTLAAGGAIALIPGDAFLDLPSERFVHEGAGPSHTVLAALDHWMNLRAASLSSPESSEPRR